MKADVEMLQGAAPESLKARPVQSEMAPRAVIDTAALSYHVLRPRSAGPADLPLLGEAYRCWSEVWRQTLLELDNLSHVPSDEFTRQDEVGALFHGYECIALSLFRWVDLGDTMHGDDSYFAVWPEAARRRACRDGTRLCVGSNITIAPAWRSAKGSSLKNILAGLIIERFKLAHDGAAMVGTMRKDRGMDTLMDRVGAERLGFTVQHHGVDVELFAYFRSSCERRELEESDESLVRKLASHIPSR